MVFPSFSPWFFDGFVSSSVGVLISDLLDPFVTFVSVHGLVSFYTSVELLYVLIDVVHVLLLHGNKKLSRVHYQYNFVSEAN